MLKDININKMKERYILYGNYWLKLISEKVLKISKEIKLKVEHGISMSNSVSILTRNSGFFNETYIKSGRIDGLLYDFGRFQQYYLSGNLKYTQFEKMIGFRNYGEYGAYILKKKL